MCIKFAVRVENCVLASFVMLLPTFMTAQYNSIFYDYKKTDKGLRCFFEYEVSSNGFQNRFTNQFIYGGYISNSTKDKALNKMHQLSNIGFMLNYGANVFFGKENHYKFVVGYKNQTGFNATYAKDFFELVFYGNKPFLGEIADISNTKVKFQRFQEVNFGIIANKEDSSAKFGVSVSLIGGLQYADVAFNKNTYLYTSKAGDSLEINTNIEAVYSENNSQNQFLDVNGIGASTNLFFEAPYKSKRGRKNAIAIHLTDLGFINWQKNTNYLTSDTNFVFEGLQINNISNTINSSLVQNTFNGVIDSSKKSHNSLLNTNLLILHNTYLNRFTTLLTFGFRHIFNRAYKPYFFSEQEFKLTPVFFILIHEGYGGYSRSNVGITLNCALNKWFIKLGTNHLQGYVISKNGYGQGGFVSLSKKF
jgi:hypothetical protein